MENEKKELQEEEMEQVNGGAMIDDLGNAIVEASKCELKKPGKLDTGRILSKALPDNLLARGKC